MNRTTKTAIILFTVIIFKVTKLKPSKQYFTVIYALYILIQLTRIAVLGVAQPILKGRKEDKREVVVTVAGTNIRKRMTYTEYDMTELKKALGSSVLQTLVTVFTSLKWKFVQPVIIQVLTFVPEIYFDPMIRAILFKVDVERPYEKNFFPFVSKRGNEGKKEVRTLTARRKPRHRRKC